MPNMTINNHGNPLSNNSMSTASYIINNNPPYGDNISEMMTVEYKIPFRNEQGN
jgi:hypothetical protein